MKRAKVYLLSKRIACALVLAATLFPNESFAFEWQKLKLFPVLGFEEGADDNAGYSRSDKTAASTTVVSPGYSLSWKNGRMLVESKGDANGKVYTANHNFNSISEETDTSVAYDVSKTISAKINHQFSHFQEPRSVAQSLGGFGGRYSYYVNQLASEVNWQALKRLVIQMKQLTEFFYFTQPALQDSVMHRWEIEMRPRLTDRSEIFASFNFGKRDFLRVSNSKISTFFGGWRYDLTKLIRLILKGGCSIVEASGKSYTRLASGATVVYTASRSTDLALTFLQQPDTSAYDEHIFDAWQVVLVLTQAITKRLKFEMNASFGRGEFQVIKVRNSLLTVNPKFSYELKRHTNLEVGTSHTLSRSNPSVNEYARNYYYAKLVVRF